MKRIHRKPPTVVAPPLEDEIIEVRRIIEPSGLKVLLINAGICVLSLLIFGVYEFQTPMYWLIPIWVLQISLAAFGIYTHTRLFDWFLKDLTSRDRQDPVVAKLVRLQDRGHHPEFLYPTFYLTLYLIVLYTALWLIGMGVVLPIPVQITTAVLLVISLAVETTIWFKMNTSIWYMSTHFTKLKT